MLCVVVHVAKNGEFLGFEGFRVGRLLERILEPQGRKAGFCPVQRQRIPIAQLPNRAPGKLKAAIGS